MHRPASGWDKNYFDKVIEPMYIKHENEVMREFINKSKKGVVPLEQAEANYFHEVWSRVSRELGLDYTREEI